MANIDLATPPSGTPPTLIQASGIRTSLGLGTLATQNGVFSGTSSGINTGDQIITLTGDVSGSGSGTFSATLASIISPGSYTSANITVDSKGRVTLASNGAGGATNPTPLVSSFYY